MRRREAVGLPLEVVERGAAGTGAGEGSGTGATGAGLGRGVQRLDHLGVAAWPSLFAYQYLFELEPVTT